jgi:hypothetical protein
MSIPSIQPNDGVNTLLEELDRRIAELFPGHPFDRNMNGENFERAIADFLAISIAFPYIQAGAIYENYRRTARSHGDTNRNVEITSAIGSFLVWDEFGGYLLSRKHGDEGLLHLTKTGGNFHSNLLRADIEKVLGKPIEPKWSAASDEYLNALLDGLSDERDSRNVACMIAFEKHAHVVIEAVWDAINRIFGIPKDSRLKYFYEHVGGDAPAEEFHIEMVQRMIGDLVPEQGREEFLAACIAEYAASIRWCEAIVATESGAPASVQPALVQPASVQPVAVPPASVPPASAGKSGRPTSLSHT